MALVRSPQFPVASEYLRPSVMTRDLMACVMLKGRASCRQARMYRRTSLQRRRKSWWNNPRMRTPARSRRFFPVVVVMLPCHGVGSSVRWLIRG